MGPPGNLRQVARGVSPRPLLTGGEEVDDLVAEHPSLRFPLAAHGLCARCSGPLTRRQNTEVRRLRLAAILGDLNQELAKDA